MPKHKTYHIPNEVQYILVFLFMIVSLWFIVSSGREQLSGEVSGVVTRVEDGRIDIRWEDARSHQTIRETFDIAELEGPSVARAEHLKEGDSVNVRYVTVRGLKTVINLQINRESTPVGT